MPKGIFTNKDLCPICKKRYIDYYFMEVTSDKLCVCGKGCKEKHEKELINK